MVVHDFACPDCHTELNDYVLPSGRDPHPHCSRCGKEMGINYSAYGRTFGGSFTGLPAERIVVYQHPDGRVQFPGRADAPMPRRYQEQGFERRELAPFEVTAFEKQKGVVCESLHWGSKGFNAPQDDPPPPPPKIEYSDLLS